MEIMKLFFTKDEDLYDKTIEDVFDDEVFDSTFWLYWRTMFAFENWHSALEMKLYFQRFIHHIGGLPDFSALKFTRYNQYESLILPMVEYLKAAGVDFQYNTEVTNVIFEISDGKKVAKAIECKVNGQCRKAFLSPRTIWYSSPTAAAPRVRSMVIRIMRPTETLKFVPAAAGASGKTSQNRIRPSAIRRSSAPILQRPTGSLLPLRRWMTKSFRISRRSANVIPRTGNVVTGGIVSCQDSSWLLSWTINRQGQFKEQEQEEGLRMGIQPLHRCSRRLYQEAHERVYR